MRRAISFASLLFLAACATSQGPGTLGPERPDVHFAPHDENGRQLHCMGPDGGWALATWSPQGRTCAAPARFIKASLCAWEQRPAGEPPEARLTAAGDGSLIGDSYRGVPICVLTAPF